MIVKSALYISSSTSVAKCPKTDLPEYAFIGRSNVGKSSLINLLTNRNRLAKTSATPGKTRLINHFLINDEWYLVDLPGYGYVKAKPGQKRKFQALITEYIKKRENLACLFLLLDSRLEPQKIDLEFITWLGESDVPFAIVFTKTDKIPAIKLNKNQQAYESVLSETWDELPPVFRTSIPRKLGREDILDFIEEINLNLKSTA